MQDFLLKMFRTNSPGMPEVYYQECIRIALDMMRIRDIKKKATD